MLLNMTVDASTSVWNHANTSVLWGWKRDDGFLQRTILFRAELKRTDNNRLYLDDWCFIYKHRAASDHIIHIYDLLNNKQVTNVLGVSPLIMNTNNKGFKEVELQAGPGLDKTYSLIHRLLKRRPRRQIPVGQFPDTCDKPFNERDEAPIALYAGSGLSYEAGLPTLAYVHEVFGVDNQSAGHLNFGLNDPTPIQLNRDVCQTFTSWRCRQTNFSI